MKSILSATICAAMMASAIPAMAATDDASTPPMHKRHHMMHGKHGMMKKGGMSGDAETAKLNEQSLQNAKAGVMPASGASSGTGMMPASGGAMEAPGTGISAPSSGAMTAPGMSAPGSTPGAMSAPGTGMATPASGAMGSGMSTNAPPITTPPAAADSNNK